MGTYFKNLSLTRTYMETVVQDPNPMVIFRPLGTSHVHNAGPTIANHHLSLMIIGVSTRDVHPNIKGTIQL